MSFVNTKHTKIVEYGNIYTIIFTINLFLWNMCLLNLFQDASYRFTIEFNISCEKAILCIKYTFQNTEQGIEQYYVS